MNRDLKLYLALTALLALALAGGGVLYLSGEARRQQEGIGRWREIRGEYMATLAQNVQGTLKDAKYLSTRTKALTNLRADRAERVKGIFLWKRGEGVTWQDGVSDAVRDAFPTTARWHAVGTTSLSAPRGWIAPVSNNADIAVAWARLGGGEVAALEVDLRDNLTGSNPGNLFKVGFSIIALLFMILLFFLWQLVRAAQLARMESDRKTTFIDNLSHELKIPLAVVRMKTERLIAGKVTDPQKLQAAYLAIAD